MQEQNIVHSDHQIT